MAALSEIINKTIPLRLGLENATYAMNLTKKGDVISVAPLPASFNANGGVERIREANLNFIKRV